MFTGRSAGALLRPELRTWKTVQNAAYGLLMGEPPPPGDQEGDRSVA